MSQERLDKLREIALRCGNCPLRESRTKLVFGEGSPSASIMFIGEGPGRKEDLSGRPFVGRSGQELRKMICSIGLKPEDCYIGNIVKCRPPNNRTPVKEEIRECVKFLKKQIEIIKPKILVLLGKTAVTGLIPEYTGTSVETLRSMTKEVGSIKYEDVPVMITYHPSALLRNPNWRPAALEDFNFLKTLDLAM